MEKKIDRLRSRSAVVALPVAALLMGLFVVGDAGAAGRKWNVPKDRGQQAIVEAVDVVAKTIKLGGKTYRVGESATLTDSKGNRIRLNDVHALGSPRPADLVEFWTRGSGRSGTPQIKRIAVKPSLSP